jgi:hypothetical protein
MDSERKGKQIDMGGKEGGICTRQSVNRFRLKNYWKRWNNTGMAIWTDWRVGNYQYMGWADAAYVQFDGLCKQIREQRKRALNMKVERMYLARSRMQLAGGGPHSRRLMGGLVETNVEVYNELVSENKD